MSYIYFFKWKIIIQSELLLFVGSSQLNFNNLEGKKQLNVPLMYQKKQTKVINILEKAFFTSIFHINIKKRNQSGKNKYYIIPIVHCLDEKTERVIYADMCPTLDF